MNKLEFLPEYEEMIDEMDTREIGELLKELTLLRDLVAEKYALSVINNYQLENKDD